MKNIPFKYLFIALFLSFGVVACNDFEDDNYDFSTSLPQYVELSTGALEAVAGGEVLVEVRLRVAIQNKVVVNYEVTGDITQTGTVEIESGQTSGTSVLSVPASPDTGTANLKLTSVDNGLSIGRGNAEDGLSNTELSITWVP